MMKLFNIVLIASCLGVFSGAMAGEGNLITNPSFEDGDKKPQGWTVWAGKKSEAQWSTQYAKSGKKSVAITTAANKSGCRWIAEEAVKVTPGAEYLLTGWIKTQKAKGNCSLSIAWYSKQGWVSTSRSLLVNRTHDWRPLKVKAKAPDNAVCAKIYVGKTRSGSGICWFDDLCFKQVSAGNAPAKSATGDTVKLKWSRNKEKQVSVSSAKNAGHLQPVKRWQKLNPQHGLSVVSKNNVYSIKDTFGYFTGWISPVQKIASGKTYQFQSELFRNKSYNVIVGMLWLDSGSKVVSASVAPVKNGLNKWLKATVTAPAPAGAKYVRLILLQRRSSGETRIRQAHFGRTEK